MILTNPKIIILFLTGQLNFVVDLFAKHFNIDQVFGAEMEVSDSKLTGKLKVGPVSQ